MRLSDLDWIIAMATHVTTSSSSISLGGVLFIVFLVLKLTDVIDWSWWWVTAPLWAGLAVFAVLMAGIFIAAAIVVLFEK